MQPTISLLSTRTQEARNRKARGGYFQASVIMICRVKMSLESSHYLDSGGYGWYKRSGWRGVQRMCTADARSSPTQSREPTYHLTTAASICLTSSMFSFPASGQTSSPHPFRVETKTFSVRSSTDSTLKLRIQGITHTRFWEYPRIQHYRMIREFAGRFTPTTTNPRVEYLLTLPHGGSCTSGA